MECPAGYHVGQVSTLLGGLTTAPSGPSCLKDSTTKPFGISNILEPILNVVLPTLWIPGIVEPAATNYPDIAQETLQVSDEGRQIIELGIDAAQTFLTSGIATEDLMGFFDDLSFDSFSDWAGDLVSEVDWGQAAGLGLDAVQTFLPQQTYGGGAVAVPVMSKVPQIAGAAAGAIAKVGPTVGRSFFNKWPNLATAIQKMRNAGQNVSRSKLYSMLKRFGPEFLVTAGIMSAAAVSELILAGPGHRRMNPANSKALRRATRRIKSFHRLCGEADVIKTRRRSFPRSCAKKC